MNAEELLRTGAVIIDKPAGPSSAEVSAWVKNVTGAKKAGHLGTLDPNVTGVLVVLLNDSCKIAGAFGAQRKEYVGIVRFHKQLPEQAVRTLFERFSGEIEQMPPRRAAVARKLRRRNIYMLELLEIAGPHALFRVSCSAGTYVRKLCHDMGVAAGYGAHMLELRRIDSGSVREERAITLQKLSDAFWLYREAGTDAELTRAVWPVVGLLELPRITVRESAIASIARGAPLGRPGVVAAQPFASGANVALVGEKGQLVAIGMAAASWQELEKSDKGLVAKPTRVMVRAGVPER